MAASDQSAGITITKNTITIIATIVTLILAIGGAAWAGISTFNSYDYRLQTLETTTEKTFSSYDDTFKILTGDIRTLNKNVTDLTIELREFRAREDVRNFPR